MGFPEECVSRWRVGSLLVGALASDAAAQAIGQTPLLTPSGRRELLNGSIGFATGDSGFGIRDSGLEDQMLCSRAVVAAAKTKSGPPR